MSTLSTTHPETPTTLPSPPFVHLKGIANFRDLGGWPISNQPAKSIRRNYIFRCAEPTKATEETIAKIKTLGITHIYDFRSNPEIKKFQISGNGGVTDWPGVERVYCPVFPEESYDPVSLAVRHADYLDGGSDGMTRAYKTALQQGVKAYTQIVRHILSHPPPGSAFIVHCTAGKDRTGVLCALLLSLSGVDDNIVAQEYSLTEAGLGAWTEVLVNAVVTQTGAPEEAARRMVGARKESMLNALKMLKEDFGGAEGYFKTQCGLKDEEVDKIKQYLVVDDKPVCGI